MIQFTRANKKNNLTYPVKTITFSLRPSVSLLLHCDWSLLFNEPLQPPNMNKSLSLSLCVCAVVSQYSVSRCIIGVTNICTFSLPKSLQLSCTQIKQCTAVTMYMYLMHQYNKQCISVYIVVEGLSLSLCTMVSHCFVSLCPVVDGLSGWHVAWQVPAWISVITVILCWLHVLL